LGAKRQEYQCGYDNNSEDLASISEATDISAFICGFNSFLSVWTICHASLDATAGSRNRTKKKMKPQMNADARR
jgi:hypothetical protein